MVSSGGLPGQPAFYVHLRASSNAGGDNFSYRMGKAIGETLGDETVDDVVEDVEEEDRRLVCLASSRKQAWLQYKAFPE
ncbi:hypothetical protein INT43_007682 [Umbelopsis isabellina]|uniref:Uncharacterized protein n=1 Tax=Mortierella isabellina TaxID=91625 RepID=A0A8H7PNF0_MORIS|nr:hypothetical protein INT43_007682 [Umbelopsis isabellina]